jgi:hypothetical protein
MNHLKTISKTDGELRVGNYMVLFGGKDLVGEFFTKNTVFKSGYTDLGLLYVDFEHGMDPDRIGNDDSCVLGTIDWKSAKADDTGIYVERVLSRRAEYMQFIEELIDAGYMGTSSAAIPGKTTKKSTGEIVEWPLMRDSLTVTPMEPRMVGENALRAAKSLHSAFPHAKSLARLCGVPVTEHQRLKTIEEIGDLNGAELYLREVGGVSRSEAKALVSRVLAIARREVGRSDESEELKAIAALLEKRQAACSA